MIVKKGVGTLRPTFFEISALMKLFHDFQNVQPAPAQEIADLLQNPELIAKFAQEAVDILLPALDQALGRVINVRGIYNGSVMRS